MSSADVTYRSSDGDVSVWLLSGALSDAKALRVELRKDGRTVAGVLPPSMIDDVAALRGWLNALYEREFPTR